MSSAKPQVVIVAPEPEAAAIRRQIADAAEVVAIEGDPASATSTVKRVGPHIALMFLDDHQPAMLGACREVAASGQAVAIAVSRRRDPDLILTAMRSGAVDFCYIDEASQDVLRAVKEVNVGRAPGSSEQRGKVITLIATKGGSGATTLATNLAAALAKKTVDGNPAKVVLLDFDLEMGDVTAFLDMTVRYSFQEVLTNAHRLDSELLYQSLARAHAGFYVISQTDFLEEGRELAAPDAGTALRFLKDHFDYVVIDGLRDFREISLVALDKADLILLTMTQDIPALKNANRCLRIFRKLGYDGTRTQIVLNRYDRSGPLTADAISDALGREISWTVRNDFPRTIKAINEGKPIVETAAGSKVAQDLEAIVARYDEEPQTVRRGLFGWRK